MHSYSLFELNEYIKRVIALNFSEPIWVNAEISQLKESRGQVYLELIQHDESSGQIVAQSNAVIWYKSYLFIKNKLGDLLPAVLNEGSHVMVKVAVEFNERYGLKLNISDVDASYTIGQMEMARKKILERLTKEGIIELNKSALLPRVIQKVAVISSEKAAGYQDFKRQLQDNSFGYDFIIDLYPSAMQGQNVEREVIKAINKINESHHYDCIAIIRGGGSKLDLSYFDNYNIAHTIAKNKYPVLSGIGHDIDQSVTDIVSFMALKTPTAVADHILELNVSYESEIINKGMLINTIGKQLINNHKIRLSSHVQFLKLKPIEILRRQKEYIEIRKSDMWKNISLLINSRKQQIENMESYITLSNPDTILKKGYAIILKDDKVIVSSKHLKTGDLLQTKMHDGIIKTEVK